MFLAGWTGAVEDMGRFVDETGDFTDLSHSPADCCAGALWLKWHFFA